MMKKNNFVWSRTYAAWLWGIICAIFFAYVLGQLSSIQLNSNVLSLLPQQPANPVVVEIEQEFLRRLDQQIVWLVRPDSPEQKDAVVQWIAALDNLEYVDVRASIKPEELTQWGNAYFTYRNALLHPAIVEELKNPQVYSDWVLAQLYSPFAGVGKQELMHDPFLLTRKQQFFQTTDGVYLDSQGNLVVKDAQGQVWYFIHATIQAEGLQSKNRPLLLQQITALQAAFQSQWPTSEWLRRGTIFYSEYAAQQAHHDATYLGTITFLGVLVLIYSAFRSLKPILLTVCSMVVGGVLGFSAVLFFFGEMHLFTLVMCISLIGVSADYTLYFLAERMVHGADENAEQSIQKITPALLGALSTTLMAYIVVLFAPFPGLKQLATFAIVGLSATCITVIVWLPFWTTGMRTRPVPAEKWVRKWLQFWHIPSRARTIAAIATLVFMVLGISRLQIEDDIQHLQALPAHLLTQDKTIAAITRQQSDQKGLLVYASSADALLEQLEAIKPLLETAKQEGWMQDYRMIPLHSPQQQQMIQSLQMQAFPLLHSRLETMGIEIAQTFTPPSTLSASEWEKSVVSQGYRLLWMCADTRYCATFISISGIKETGTLEKMVEKIRFISTSVEPIDKKTQFSTLFSLYRQYLSVLLLIAFVCIITVLIFRYGWRRGLVAVLPTLISILAGLAILGVTGRVFNLFGLLALVLVLGMGMNYTFLFSNRHGAPETALWGILLAMSTTLLTLGVLVFSTTTAISSFGLVLVMGLFTAFLFAPIVAHPNYRH